MPIIRTYSPRKDLRVYRITHALNMRFPYRKGRRRVEKRKVVVQALSVRVSVRRLGEIITATCAKAASMLYIITYAVELHPCKQMGLVQANDSSWASSFSRKMCQPCAVQAEAESLRSPQVAFSPLVSMTVLVIVVHRFWL